MHDRRPDLVLIVPDLHTRRLLLAQLLEEGLDVVPVDHWPAPRPWPRPRAVVLDLDGLENAPEALADLETLIGGDHVIILSGVVSGSADEIRPRFPHVRVRPFSIGQVVEEVRRVLRPSGTARAPR